MLSNVNSLSSWFIIVLVPTLTARFLFRIFLKLCLIPAPLTLQLFPPWSFLTKSWVSVFTSRRQASSYLLSLSYQEDGTRKTPGQALGEFHEGHRWKVARFTKPGAPHLTFLCAHILLLLQATQVLSLLTSQISPFSGLLGISVIVAPLGWWCYARLPCIINESSHMYMLQPQ